MCYSIGKEQKADEEMKKQRIEISEAEKSGDRKRVKENASPRVYKRLMALKLRLLDGVSSEQAGEYVGLHVSSVNKILHRYQEQGIEALVMKRRDHGNRYMTR